MEIKNQREFNLDIMFQQEGDPPHDFRKTEINGLVAENRQTSQLARQILHH